MVDTEMTNPEPKTDIAEGASKGRTTRVYVGNLSWKVRAQDLHEHMERCGEVRKVDIFEDYNGRSKGCAIVEYANAADAEKAMKELTDTRLFERPIFVREDRESGASAAAAPRRQYNERGSNGYRNRDYEASGSNNRMHRNYGREERYNSGGNGNAGGKNNSHGGNSAQYVPGNRFGGSSNGNNGGNQPQRTRTRDDDHGRMLFISNLPYKTSWQELKDLFRKCGTVIRADVMCYPDGRSRGVGTVLFDDPSAAETAINDMHGYLHDGRQLTVRLDRC